MDAGDKKAVAEWLRRYGLLPDALRPVPRAEISRRKRDRERLARAAERLAVEDRKLRVMYAAECRALEGLRQRTVQRLREVQDSAAATQCEELLAYLPDLARRAAASHALLVFGDQRTRASFTLQPDSRDELIGRALLGEVRDDAGRPVEVSP